MKKFVILGFLFILLVAVTAPVFAEEAYTVPQSYYNSQNQTAPVPAAEQAPALSAEPVAVETAAAPVSSEPVSTTSHKSKTQSSLLSNPAYLSTEVGQIRAELEKLKKDILDVQKAKGTAGYDGGFYVKSEDDKFKLVFNPTISYAYDFAIVPQVDDAHGGVPGAGIAFSGNCFSEKLTYLILYLMVNAPPAPVVAFDVAYEVDPKFVLHINRGKYLSSEAGGDFIFNSLAKARFASTSLGLGFTGKYKSWSYYAYVMQKYGSWTLPTVNNELGYAGKIDYTIMKGDNKPTMNVAALGGLYHEETGTQARVIQGAANYRFSYKRFKSGVEGYYRQIDPDQFTLAQTDMGYLAWAGYDIVKNKLQFIILTSGLIDDITDSGDNLNHQTLFNDNVFSTGDVNNHVLVGDKDGDEYNEYEYSAGLNYWPLGSPTIAVRAQYCFVIDGTANGDLRSHVGELALSFDF